MDRPKWTTFTGEVPPSSPSRLSPDGHTLSRDGTRAFSPSDGAFSPDGARVSPDDARAFSPDGKLRTGLRREDGSQFSKREWSLHEPAFSGAGAARLPAMLPHLKTRTSSSASPVRRESSSTALSPDGMRVVSRADALQAARQSLSSGVLEWTAAFSSDGEKMAFSPDGKRVRMLRSKPCFRNPSTVLCTA